MNKTGQSVSALTAKSPTRGSSSLGSGMFAQEWNLIQKEGNFSWSGRRKVRA